MGMTRQFEKPDYEGILKTTIQVGEALPEDHLARFVVHVISVLDLGLIYGRYANVGGKAIAPEVLLGLLVYGYASGVFSSRRINGKRMRIWPFGLRQVGCILTTTR